MDFYDWWFHTNSATSISTVPHLYDAPPNPIYEPTRFEQLYNNIEPLYNNQFDTTSSSNHLNYEKTYVNTFSYNTNQLSKVKSDEHKSNLYSTPTPDSYPQYGTVNNQRLYSEISESVYHEIPDHLYSQVPDETLRPHRPAPTKPDNFMSQPLSMQQIQRKIQQGQVKKFWFLLPQ